MRKTKIICTLGPASSTYETIKELVLAGMDVVRINMSHGTHAEHLQKIEIIRQLRKELNKSIPLLIDTKGPETRIRTFKNGKIDIVKGQEFIFTTDEIEGDSGIVSVNYENLHRDLKKGSKILLNNGLLEFAVSKIEGTKIYTKALNGGVLSDRKSMFFPGTIINLPFLSDADIEDLEFAIKVDADFIAASFVSSSFDLREIKGFLRRKKATSIEVIAKIESQKGVENIEEIMRESDGIMVARGDLGVEIAYEKLPAIQKRLIKTSKMLGKRVIVATEMLESMIENLRPTRAEISDVANAVYDGASCIMLSGESSIGRDPANVVRVMSRIATEAEGDIDYKKRFHSLFFEPTGVQDAMSQSACNMAIELKAKAIVVFTNSGMSARMVSRFRPPMPIIGVTSSEKVFRKLNLSWGVVPMMSAVFSDTDQMFVHAKECALNSQVVSSGDLIVVTAGVPLGTGMPTNLIKAEIL